VKITGLPDEEYYWQIEVHQRLKGDALHFRTLQIPKCWGLRALVRVKELVASGATDIDAKRLLDEGYIDIASASDPSQQPPSFVQKQTSRPQERIQ
jgi:hypothetical protein